MSSLIVRNVSSSFLPVAHFSLQTQAEINRPAFRQVVGRLNGAIAEILLSTSPLDAVTTLSEQLDVLAKEIFRTEAKFLHRFLSIFDDLLDALERDASSKTNISPLCSRLGELNDEFLRQIEPNVDVNPREKLLVAAKLVANTTAVYVLKGKEIAGKISEAALINELISRATQCALATSQLVACTKVIAAEGKFFSSRPKI